MTPTIIPGASLCPVVDGLPALTLAGDDRF
jgi:hypothetical protein